VTFPGSALGLARALAQAGGDIRNRTGAPRLDLDVVAASGSLNRGRAAHTLRAGLGARSPRDRDTFSACPHGPCAASPSGPALPPLPSMRPACWPALDARSRTLACQRSPWRSTRSRPSRPLLSPRRQQGARAAGIRSPPRVAPPPEAPPS
jgi:hypothetical protein